MAYPIAYQLYSSRNFPPLEAQLPILKGFGYDAIEPWLPAYEADDGVSFRRALDATGLKCFGFHMPLAGLVGETVYIAHTDATKTGLNAHLEEVVGYIQLVKRAWIRSDGAGGRPEAGTAFVALARVAPAPHH